MSDPSLLTSQSTPIRLLIVDDQPLVRQGLTGLLELEDHLEIVGEAANGQEALRLTETLHPDVVLMDIKMPVMGGIEATAHLRESGGPAVVLLTTFEELDDMVAGINAGAAGYIFKSASIDEIIDTITRVSKGEQVINSRVAVALAKQVSSHSSSTFHPSQVNSTTQSQQTNQSDLEITKREKDILRCIIEGQSNKHIAQTLNIAEGTVKVHVGKILEKLEVKNRTEAAIRANQLGLLQD